MVWFEKDTYCDMFMSYRFTWEHSYVPYMSVKCDMHLIKSVFSISYSIILTCFLRIMNYSGRLDTNSNMNLSLLTTKKEKLHFGLIKRPGDGRLEEKTAGCKIW